MGVTGDHNSIITKCQSIYIYYLLVLRSNCFGVELLAVEFCGGGGSFSLAIAGWRDASATE